MGDIKWIKLSVDLFHNRKIRQIEHMPEGDTLVLIWIKLLLLAGQINDGGLVYITPEVGYGMESLAAELGRPLKLVQPAMELFCRFGMTEIDEQGIIRVCGWEKHQNVEGMERVRQQNRERKRKQRAREQAALPCHGTVTQGHATEEEKEEEREEEKEIHSLIHAQEEACEWEKEQRKYLGGALGRGVVLLSDGQLEDLLDKLSLEEFDRYVSIVADNELSGKHYTKKTHYQAILDMAAKDRRLRRKGE